MATDSGHTLESLSVDGGLSNSDLCMQTQADLSGIPVDRPAMRETTALGAAIAAGLATGVWDSTEQLCRFHSMGRTVFEPDVHTERRAEQRKKWEQAVNMSRGWVTDRPPTTSQERAAEPASGLVLGAKVVSVIAGVALAARYFYRRA